MNRYLISVCLLALFGLPAMAQPGASFPGYQSPVSPYLNLLRPGNSPGFNYYGLVKPQLQFQNDITNLQQQTTVNRTAITDLNGTLVPTTGHSAYFHNTGSYYPNWTATGAGATGGGPRTASAGRGSQQGQSASPQVPQVSGANAGFPSLPSVPR